MTKEAYLESQRGEAYIDIVSNQPTEQVVGSIRGENLRDVVTVFAGGLKHRLDTAPVSPTRTAILTAYDNLMLPDFALNLGLPPVRALLDGGVTEGLMEPTERDILLALATYERPLYAVTIRDCVAYFEPARIAAPDTWVEEAGEYTGGTLRLRVLATAPENVAVVVQLQDIYEDGTVSEWYHGTAINGVKLRREYTAALPVSGYPRRLRWSCPYVLDAALTVV